MLTLDLVVPVGRDDEALRLVDAPAEHVQGVERRLVRPVDVLEDDDRGPASSARSARTTARGSAPARAGRRARRRSERRCPRTARAASASRGSRTTRAGRAARPARRMPARASSSRRRPRRPRTRAFRPARRQKRARPAARPAREASSSAHVPLPRNRVQGRLARAGATGVPSADGSRRDGANRARGARRVPRAPPRGLCRGPGTAGQPRLHRWRGRGRQDRAGAAVRRRARRTPRSSGADAIPYSRRRRSGPFLEIAAHAPSVVSEAIDGGGAHAIATALLAADDRRMSLVIVLEDVHWADEATLDVLRVLGRGWAAHRPS